MEIVGLLLFVGSVLFLGLWEAHKINKERKMLQLWREDIQMSLSVIALALINIEEKVPEDI